MRPRSRTPWPGCPRVLLVVVDGLVASAHPQVLEPESGRLRLVVLVHLPLGLGGPDGGAGDRRESERAALRCVAAVVTTSRWTRRWLLDAYGLDPARVVVAVPGVEAAEVVAGSPGGRRLLCVGAVIPAKGHDVLVEALARVSVRDWGCECVGSLERDPVFVDRLRARAADLGVADRVRLSGPLVGAELESAYAGCDLLVTASRGETYGMVVTEALARGIPVLATRVGGLPGGARPGTRRAAARHPRAAGRRGRLSRAPWSSGSGTRPCGRTCVRRPGPGGPCCPPGPPRAPWWPACSPTWRPEGSPVNPVAAAPVGPVSSGDRSRPGVDERREAGIDASWWRWARPLGGALVLGALVVGLGAGPFVDAVRATDVRSLAAGALIAVVTTGCAAWRWRLVARRLGAELTMGGAVASCYRAQFLNSTLPGGVLGDVGRGVQHGRGGGDVGRGLRAVAWERTAGQVVLVGLTVVALLVARPFDLPRPGGVAAPVLVVGLLVLVAVAAVLARGGGHRVRTVVRVAGGDLRALVSGPASVGIVLASVVVVAGHLATFVLAARTVGVRTPVTALLPLALVVLVVSAVPLNLAGWGPREGAAAWVFAAAGLGAAPGLATAVAFGAIAFVATLPGAVLLLVDRVRRAPRAEALARTPAPLLGAADGASRG